MQGKCLMMNLLVDFSLTHWLLILSEFVSGMMQNYRNDMQENVSRGHLDSLTERQSHFLMVCLWECSKSIRTKPLFLPNSVKSMMLPSRKFLFLWTASEEFVDPDEGCGPRICNKTIFCIDFDVRGIFNLGWDELASKIALNSSSVMN